jgi:hypothetical protein
LQAKVGRVGVGVGESESGTRQVGVGVGDGACWVEERFARPDSRDRGRLAGGWCGVVVVCSGGQAEAKQRPNQAGTDRDGSDRIGAGRDGTEQCCEG